MCNIPRPTHHPGVLPGSLRTLSRTTGPDVNSALLCLAVALTAPNAGPDAPSVYHLNSPFESNENRLIFRGQTPGPMQPYDEVPPPNPGGMSPSSPTFVQPNVVPDGQMIYPQYPMAGPPGTDPFLPGQPGPGYGGYGPSAVYSSVGPQAYRLNRWVSRYDVGFLPKAENDRGFGHFAVFEFDAAWEYATPLCFDWIFSFTQQFDYRAWDGPSTSPMFPTSSLPGSVYRFGWDLKLATPANNPWSAMIAFNPSLNSDFQSSLGEDAWNFDGRGMIFWRPSEQWTWVGGAGYLDRVNDKVIPYAGFIWTPDPRWEWRILYPESRVSYLLGNPWGLATWLYARGEYHIEAYEVKLPSGQEQVELEDWRILMGLRFDNGFTSCFVEAGWVFGRDVEFKNATPGFSPDTGFIARLGIRY